MPQKFIFMLKSRMSAFVRLYVEIMPLFYSQTFLLTPDVSNTKAEFYLLLFLHLPFFLNYEKKSNATKTYRSFLHNSFRQNGINSI